jgi:hypothetical protein
LTFALSCCRSRARLFTLTIAATLVAPIPRAAHAQASQDDAIVACVSPIMTCGCTITKRGLFLIGANLTSSQELTAKGGCIDIKAT